MQIFCYYGMLHLIAKIAFFLILRSIAVCGRKRLLPVEPAGLCESQRSVSEGAGVQLQVPDNEAVRRWEGGQLQRGTRTGGAGRVSQRHGGTQTKSPVQLQVQKGHEEGEELLAHLLGLLSEFTG